MKVTYDPNVDAAYIVFEEGNHEVTTQRLTEDIAINYSKDGKVVGIEILSASEHLFKDRSMPVIELENLKVAA